MRLKGANLLSGVAFASGLTLGKISRLFRKIKSSSLIAVNLKAALREIAKHAKQRSECLELFCHMTSREFGARAAVI